MVTKEISPQLFIARKQDALAHQLGATVAIAMVNDAVVYGGYAFVDSVGSCFENAIFSVYYQQAGRCFSTLAYLSVEAGMYLSLSTQPDTACAYSATVVGQYPETPESLLCFTARKKRLPISRPDPLLSGHIKATAADFTGIKMVILYPAGLFILERDVALVSMGMAKYIFVAAPDNDIESGDLPTLESEVFAHLLKNELTY